MNNFSKINLKLVRSFSVGFTVASPTLNGLYIEFHLGCFHLVVWHKPSRWFGFNNYWGG